MRLLHRQLKQDQVNEYVLSDTFYFGWLDWTGLLVAMVMMSDFDWSRRAISADKIMTFFYPPFPKSPSTRVFNRGEGRGNKSWFDNEGCLV